MVKFALHAAEKEVLFVLLDGSVVVTSVHYAELATADGERTQVDASSPV